jgi:hypothetical protein
VTARTVLEALEGSVASTLSGGYAVLRDGSRNLFEPATIEKERRNRQGRCTFASALYRDGSRLVFRWSEAGGSRYRVEEARKKQKHEKTLRQGDRVRSFA